MSWRKVLFLVDLEFHYSSLMLDSMYLRQWLTMILLYLVQRFKFSWKVIPPFDNLTYSDIIKNNDYQRFIKNDIIYQ